MQAAGPSQHKKNDPAPGELISVEPVQEESQRSVQTLGKLHRVVNKFVILICARGQRPQAGSNKFNTQLTSPRTAAHYCFNLKLYNNNNNKATERHFITFQPETPTCARDSSTVNNNNNNIRLKETTKQTHSCFF